MMIRKFDEGEPFRCAGNNFVMLLPRDLTDCCEDGGWRKVYQAIIEDYAGRGYPQDGPSA
ncbi:MAG: hypothetical protein ACLQVN_06300 [Bryobacteraceae bacterium]